VASDAGGCPKIVRPPATVVIGGDSTSALMTLFLPRCVGRGWRIRGESVYIFPAQERLF
jgi:hypothetical protein